MKNVLVLCLLLSGLCACSSSKKAAKAAEEAAALQEYFESVAATAEVMPRFQDGDHLKFRAWVMSHVEYPAELYEEYVNGYHPKLEGRVTALFVVERDGSIEQLHIQSAPNRQMREEVRRVILSSPKWTPGVQKGEPVRVRFTLPVDFSLPASTKEQLAKQREAKAASRLDR